MRIVAGSIVVRTDDGLGCLDKKFRSIGVMFKALEGGEMLGNAYYARWNCISPGYFRFATYNEIEAFNKGVRNVNDIFRPFNIYF